MIGKVVNMPILNACMFSATEAAVLLRLQQGVKVDTIASELDLAGPIVKEYIRSILRKVRTGRTHPSAVAEAST